MSLETSDRATLSARSKKGNTSIYLSSASSMGSSVTRWGDAMIRPEVKMI